MRLWVGAMVGVALFLMGAPELVRAEEREPLLVCAPCSRAFFPEAERVVRDLGLEGRVAVTLSSCLGPCQQGHIIAFRGEVYRAMDADTLRTLLQVSFSLP